MLLTKDDDELPGNLLESTFLTINGHVIIHSVTTTSQVFDFKNGMMQVEKKAH